MADEPAPEPKATRRLSYRPLRSARDVLLEVAEQVDPGLEQDNYGGGEVVEDLEHRVSEMLGHEAGVLMPSGTMAQQIALRIWCDRANLHHVAFHPTCHLELHEEDAYRRLHGLSATLLGSPDRLFDLDDLASMREPAAAVVFELPQREIGGQLPPWEGLVAMTSWARERGIATHLDGARLWETQPFYDRPYTEIAGLFDSVYVSFYKILGGIAGAALVGPQDLIDTARVWQRRHGGNLVHMYPLALSARLGLDRELERMGEYHTKAVEIAAVLTSLPGITVTPDPPHTNMMHVFIEGDIERLRAAHGRIIDEEDVELFRSIKETGIPAINRFELVVAGGTVEFETNQIRDLFSRLLEHAHS